MSAIALTGAGALALWLIASIVHHFGVTWLQRALAPLDRFRFFGPWAMFASGAGRKGAYGLAYRDRSHADDSTPWTLAAAGYHWSWHVFLLDPRRTIAEAVHNTGRDLHRHLQQRPSPAATREIAFAQARLRDYLHHLAPPSAGATREIRVIKQLGPDASPHGEIICEFSATPDAEQ